MWVLKTRYGREIIYFSSSMHVGEGTVMVATVFVSKIDAVMKTYIKRPLNTFAEMSKNFLLKLLVVTNVCW